VEENISIFETAFVTADFRALDVALSKDTYAHLWPTKRTQEYRKEYVAEVSDHEPFAHCLRNRFFLDAVAQLYQKGEIAILINFGCGFSMYPFLLPQSLEHIEIDMPNSIAFKKEKIRHWQEKGILPPRKVSFLAADFNTDYATDLKQKILMIKGNKKCFILLEGVLFFIDGRDTQVLFQLFRELQHSNEYIGSVSFPKETEQSMVFEKLSKFASKRLNANEKFEYQTIEDDFYEHPPGYDLIEHQHTLSLATSYVSTIQPDAQEVLNEHLYILKKK